MLSINASPSPTLYFGWRPTNPNLLDLRPGADFTVRGSNPVATDRFVHQAAEALHRSEGDKGLEDYGYNLATDLRPLGSLRQAENFLWNLLPRIARDFADNHPDALNIPPEKRVLVSMHVQDGRSDLVSPNGKADAQGRKWTATTPHFDAYADLVAHLYPPTHNIEGGHLQIYDIRQYLADHPGTTLADITNQRATNHLDLTLPPEELEPYRLTIERRQQNPFIVIFNNITSPDDPERVGVAHGATPVTVLDPGKDFYRGYKRISLTTRRPGKVPDGVQIEDF